MENTDIPQFHTYRGEIEFEGTLIPVSYTHLTLPTTPYV